LERHITLIKFQTRSIFLTGRVEKRREEKSRLVFGTVLSWLRFNIVTI
jgi:hypothetical protein